MCIQCRISISDNIILDQFNLEINNPPDFSKYNLTSILHIIYACIGINGEECQKSAKILLNSFRNWYINGIHHPLFAFDNEFDANTYQIYSFCPNAQKFAAMCDDLIAYNDEEGRSAEFKKAFIYGNELCNPEFASIKRLLPIIKDGVRPDPENFIPIIPFTTGTFRMIGNGLIISGILLISIGLSKMLMC